MQEVSVRCVQFQYVDTRINSAACSRCESVRDTSHLIGAQFPRQVCTGAEGHRARPDTLRRGRPAARVPELYPHLRALLLAELHDPAQRVDVTVGVEGE